MWRSLQLLAVGCAVTLTVGCASVNSESTSENSGTPASAAISVVDLAPRDWDSADWARSLCVALEARLETPYAYRLGLVSGRADIEFSVKPSGDFESIREVKFEGHQSLVDAALAAVSEVSGRIPLPGEMSGQKAVVVVSFLYPEFRKAR